MTQPIDAESSARAASPRDAQGSAGPMFTQALRVAVKRSVRDGELIVARLLEDGTPPPGMKPAMLVLLEADEDLLQAKF